MRGLQNYGHMGKSIVYQHPRLRKAGTRVKLFCETRQIRRARDLGALDHRVGQIVEMLMELRRVDLFE